MLTILRCGLVLVALIAGTLFASPASADFVYTYSSTVSAPLAGPMSGQFVVLNSAIADGFISASEVTSFSFTLSSAAAPFMPATFAPFDTLTIFSPNMGRIPVNPTTGAFVADALIQIVDSATGQLLDVTALGGYEVDTSGGSVAQGVGQWTLQQVTIAPVPVFGHWSLIALSIGLALLAAIRVIQLRTRLGGNG